MSLNRILKVCHKADKLIEGGSYNYDQSGKGVIRAIESEERIFMADRSSKFFGHGHINRGPLSVHVYVDAAVLKCIEIAKVGERFDSVLFQAFSTNLTTAVMQISMTHAMLHSVHFSWNDAPTAELVFTAPDTVWSLNFPADNTDTLASEGSVQIATADLAHGG